ncbi:hypothetical protein F7Q95_11550 [Pseudomonas psychrophila]|nr:hypothetical protein F7Q95_11550 [Pseudomonas psychrophila]
MAQHGSPGIHAGRPTAQNLLSASRRGGQINSRLAEAANRPACHVAACARTVAASFYSSAATDFAQGFVMSVTHF